MNIKKDLFRFSNSVTVELPLKQLNEKEEQVYFYAFLYALKLQNRLYTNYEN